MNFNKTMGPEGQLFISGLPSMTEKLADSKNPLNTLKEAMMQIFIQLEQNGNTSSQSQEIKEYFTWLKSLVGGTNSEMMALVKNYCKIKTESYDKVLSIRRDIKLAMEEHPVSTHPGNDDTQAICVEGFLYDDEKHVLESHHIKSTSRCANCDSTDVQPLLIISHSASLESLLQLFVFRLPNLSAKKLLDIGSGIGSVLYGAFYFSMADSITGIELNEDFCKIVDTIVEKYRMQDRVKIVQGNFMNFGNLIEEQDVVIINNAFQYFASPEIQKQMWQSISCHTKPGGLLVTNPDLITLLKPFNLEHLLPGWVEQLKPQQIDEDTLHGFDEADEKFCVYRITSNKCTSVATAT